MNIAEHKLNLFRQIDALPEESLIELEKLIAHRLDVTSLELPEHVAKARIIIMYEGMSTDKSRLGQDIDGILARSRGILGNQSMDEIDAELKS